MAQVNINLSEFPEPSVCSKRRGKAKIGIETEMPVR